MRLRSFLNWSKIGRKTSFVPVPPGPSLNLEKKAGRGCKPAPATDGIRRCNTIRLLVALLADFALLFGFDAAGVLARFAFLGGFVAAGALGVFLVGAKGGNESEEGDDGEHTEQFLHDVLFFRFGFGLLSANWPARSG
jgi:hypothetical protein